MGGEKRVWSQIRPSFQLFSLRYLLGIHPVAMMRSEKAVHMHVLHLMKRTRDLNLGVSEREGEREICNQALRSLNLSG